MLNLISVSLSLLLILFIGWTLITYFLNKDSQQLIREELSNLFDIFQKFFLSIKTLIKILASTSLYFKEKKVIPLEKTVLQRENQSSNQVEQIKEIKDLSIELGQDDDEELSSFSPEVVDVIYEEEEKVA